ncbi:PREDICTED: T-cell surface antigen CD2 [Myotis davidii]|uniref:T-cell surface antigen CD2 n=1 Tax=Myotis davidii TaxID=225400 RepID=L5LXL8_MYODS|nr:PREDICTED: T-cell surface antigen CD2 [Myotis davidii]ELK30846.1 T-cell surface antigen CD2 [Myotis davidii]
MNFACTILASCLLTFIPSTTGVTPTVTVLLQGILNDDINMIVPDPPSYNIYDILWEKNRKRIIRRLNGKITPQQQEKYQVFENGTLKIKHLQRNDSDIYKVDLYDSDGRHMLTQTFDLKILEKVSKPVINWNCANATITCEVTQGTDPKITLYRYRNIIKEGQKIIRYKGTIKSIAPFNCTATNGVSVETSMVHIDCSEKRLDIPLIVGICGGGIFFLLFVALLILFISKRKKQHRRGNGGKLELRAHRTTSEERSRRPYQIPASAPPNAAASQAPPPPGHHPQAHGPRPPPPGQRAQHQQQRRPLPCPGAPVHQQKGPPLPTPRVQPKPPRGARENTKQSSGRAVPVV